MYKTLNNSKQILVAPLDWGLGHATRCIPLIRACLDLGHTVTLAGEGPSMELLKESFPSLEFVHLAGYRVRYASRARMLPAKILAQLPRLLQTIHAEHRWLKHLLEKRHFDLVISDNRYGLFTSNIPCVFITHQVEIRIPQSEWLQRLVNHINHWFIRQYKACLIPDYPGGDSMAGELSAPGSLPAAHYLGNLSRFGIPSQTPYTYDLLVLLSGPEPQRTLLEKIIREQAVGLQLKTLMVLGKPASGEKPLTEGNLLLRPHVPAGELEQLIMQSKLVIARAGYSTIMDLCKLGRHAILIPTPGQTEQHYLGRNVSEKNWFVVTDQETLSLPMLIKAYEQKQFSPFPEWAFNRYKTVMKELLETLP